MTARLELYPRTLSPDRALQLSQVASYLAHPGIEPDQLRDRVIARFPALAETLPEPGELRNILIGLGHKVEVSTGPDGRQRYSIPGGTLVPLWSSTRGPTSLSQGGDPGQSGEAWLRLRPAAERGGFLTIKASIRESAELAALDGVTAVPVARLFVTVLRDIVTERGKPRWDTVIAADSPEAAPNAQAGWWKRRGSGSTRTCAPSPASSCCTTPPRWPATPAAWTLLTRLASAARQADETPHGLWLLCPMQSPREPARLDGLIVGALGDGEQLAIRPSARPERRAS